MFRRTVLGSSQLGRKASALGICAFLAADGGFAASAAPRPGRQPSSPDAPAVQAEHAQIDVESGNVQRLSSPHPAAQWFPDAALGLFIHWGLSSVRAMNISWPMIAGRPVWPAGSVLSQRRIADAAERERILHERDFDLSGKPALSPDEYWSMAPTFNPRRYDPERWLRAVKAAGFTYVVLTARHHEGFALWPSAYGDFNTKSFMGGRDLVRPFVDACHRQGLKVGLYYSPPDWHFDREYMDFLFQGVHATNPEFPALGPDLLPRRAQKSDAELAAHQAAYAEMIRGQVEELLTRYGRIDLLWFDGRPPLPRPETVISLERIRELQPGIVVNPRFHGSGDFVTFERRLPATRPPVDWAEFCNTWTSSWSHQEIPFRANAFVLGQLALARSWGINYLLGVGPTADGELCPEVYRNMAVVARWMKDNGHAIRGATRLPMSESSSVPATARHGSRYLFAIPRFKAESAYPEDQLAAKDEVLILSGVPAPRAVRLLAPSRPLVFSYKDGVVSVDLPARLRTNLVDVVQVDLGARPGDGRRTAR